MKERNMIYDVVIIGGGPSGLSAALSLGRARKRVLLCDSGAPRNAAAERIHNFVTRDGTPPAKFRALASEELAKYKKVEQREARMDSITGTEGAFRVSFAGGQVEARRVLLCTGMIDEMLAIEGFDELWSRSIFQCPYCHGFEVQDRAWGFLVQPERAEHLLPFALLARGWTEDLTVYTGGTFEVPPETRAILDGAGIVLRSEPITRLIKQDGHLKAVELSSGAVPCDVIFTHPPQRQVPVVHALELELDDVFVRVDAMGRTSVPGIYAAGDLCTQMQTAIMGAAAGAGAAAAINISLAMEVASLGAP